MYHNFILFTSPTYLEFAPLYILSAGLSAQTDASAAAASLLTPNLPLNNLVTLAAMAQQQPSLAAAAQPTAAQLTNAATSLCKYQNFQYNYLLVYKTLFQCLTPHGAPATYLRIVNSYNYCLHFPQNLDSHNTFFVCIARMLYRWSLSRKCIHICLVCLCNSNRRCEFT